MAADFFGYRVALWKPFPCLVATRGRGALDSRFPLLSNFALWYSRIRGQVCRP